MDKDRLKKLDALKEKGILAFPERFERTHSLERAYGEKKGAKAVVAGRIMTMREMGKLAFVHLQDQSRKMQIVFELKHIGEEKFKLLKLFDIGDIIGVEGEIFTTQKGEISVLVKDYSMLSKALRPLPEKWHGVKDREICYRQRYLDLTMNKETKDRFLFRSKFIKTVRNFLEDNDFLEIETPILAAKAGGALAKPFVTHHNALDIEAYLRIAPETYLKRATVGGFERIFELARCFRNEGIDPSHLQEFTMLEYYVSYWNYEDNMNFTEKLITHVLDKLYGTLKVKIENQEIDFKTPWPRKKFRDLILEDSGIDIDKHKDVKSLKKAIKEKKIEIEDMNSFGLPNLMDALYKKVSRPKLVKPTFVIQHPVDLKPLARKNDKNPLTADTFQLLVNGWEIVNAYSEIVDPVDQRERFEEQSRLKAAGDEEAMEAEEDFLVCMEHGMPPQSGWGMGIDRIVTLLTGQDNLKDTILFPLMRPEGGAQDSSSNVSTENSGGAEGDKGLQIDVGITYKEAKKLVDEYIKDPGTRNHMRESEVIMRGLAKHFGADEDAWGILGLLHDIDWELTKDDHAQHTVKCVEILKKAGMTDEAIDIIVAHGYGACGGHEDKVRTKFLEHALAAAETITGLVYATALVYPSKKLADVKVKSIAKRMKAKDFARNCDRNVIKEAEKLGITMDEFYEIALKAMQKIAEEIGV
jgi:lysyl-tRNA synthetase class 2